MFTLSSISSSLEFWFVDQTVGEISNNWPKGLLGANLYKTRDFCSKLLLTIFQWTKTIIVISNRGTFSPSLFLVILL